ncbi:hypothetical protein AB8A31_10005 [Tardiphaga sp. 804_B3_N1_9]|nr:hypothetical protein [Tardiphaga robiniae]NUU39920.1 hypothetical protein [Tardiphaga robiniae]
MVLVQPQTAPANLDGHPADQSLHDAVDDFLHAIVDGLIDLDRGSKCG